MTSKDPFPATGRSNIERTTSLTVGSVFAWALNINLKFLSMLSRHDIECPNTDKSQYSNVILP